MQKKLSEVEEEKEQVSDSLTNIHKLQCGEVELGWEAALPRGFREAKNNAPKYKVEQEAYTGNQLKILPLQVDRGVQVVQIVQKADDVSTEKYGESYLPTEQGGLRGYIKARLGAFYEVLGYVPRIDRIVRQSQGRLLPLGAFGAGRTTLSQSDCADGKMCCILNEPSGVDPDYSPVKQGKRRGYIKARLKGFYEEELNGALGL